MTKEIKILGSCCNNCNHLYDTVVEAVHSTGIDAEVSQVSDIAAIIALGVMTTPAMLIDGRTVVMGRVPSLAEVEKLLAE